MKKKTHHKRKISQSKTQKYKPFLSHLSHLSRRSLNKQPNIKMNKNKNTDIDCCQIRDDTEHLYKKCVRNYDGKVFSLPRRFSRSQCKNVRGFTMRSSCAPYKKCK